MEFKKAERNLQLLQNFTLSSSQTDTCISGKVFATQCPSQQPVLSSISNELNNETCEVTSKSTGLNRGSTTLNEISSPGRLTYTNKFHTNNDDMEAILNSSENITSKIPDCNLSHSTNDCTFSNNDSKFIANKETISTNIVNTELTSPEISLSEITESKNITKLLTVEESSEVTFAKNSLSTSSNHELVQNASSENNLTGLCMPDTTITKPSSNYSQIKNTICNSKEPLPNSVIHHDKESTKENTTLRINPQEITDPKSNLNKNTQELISSFDGKMSNPAFEPDEIITNEENIFLSTQIQSRLDDFEKENNLKNKLSQFKYTFENSFIPHNIHKPIKQTTLLPSNDMPKPTKRKTRKPQNITDKTDILLQKLSGNSSKYKNIIKMRDKSVKEKRIGKKKSTNKHQTYNDMEWDKILKNLVNIFPKSTNIRSQQEYLQFHGDNYKYTDSSLWQISQLPPLKSTVPENDPKNEQVINKEDSLLDGTSELKNFNVLSLSQAMEDFKQNDKNNAFSQDEPEFKVEANSHRLYSMPNNDDLVSNNDDKVQYVASLQDFPIPANKTSHNIIDELHTEEHLSLDTSILDNGKNIKQNDLKNDQILMATTSTSSKYDIHSFNNDHDSIILDSDLEDLAIIIPFETKEYQRLLPVTTYNFLNKIISPNFQHSELIFDSNRSNQHCISAEDAKGSLDIHTTNEEFSNNRKIKRYQSNIFTRKYSDIEMANTSLKKNLDSTYDYNSMSEHLESSFLSKRLYMYLSKDERDNNANHPFETIFSISIKDDSTIICDSEEELDDTINYSILQFHSVKLSPRVHPPIIKEKSQSAQKLRVSMKTIGLKPLRSKSEMLQALSAAAELFPNDNILDDTQRKEEIHKLLTNLIRNSPRLLEKVYCFEPLFLDSLIDELVSMNPFVDYIDEGSIREWADIQGICLRTR
ncbi:hypothetical protein TBLA_0A04010 [Henningerozyma blattae CBS 6284]|uniref:Structure-specific endonuclease subunit SLX4 n=1 Tax=Henningerozyma blattae (strain ATCC 34711 / CBS 6284 / DSM 70876 / NBRC 10599 / NRRL Y-10934 / UCD 77-7) TaxID=1071380 RepID=I2GVP5_HENB6|nr:hypothetical protein TBLA_0A04010 [Tetrapisispora blattae CBS 6284]CCH58197.1 hypothetical protein TBLA_0A04010 [Tetrapisispora blattae CBS 6284]